MLFGIDLLALYTFLLVVSLWANGIVTVTRQGLGELFIPLRNARLVTGSLLIDVLLVPAVMMSLILILPGMTEGNRIGLVLIAAASTGPIGSVLTRMMRGDVPLATSLIAAFGGLNLLTVPLIGAVLLGRTVPFPLGPVVSSMLLLVFLPLCVGYVWRRITFSRKVDAAGVAAQMRVLATISTTFLGAAILLALVTDFAQVIEMLSSSVGVLSVITMVVISLAAALVGDTPARRATLAIVLNARAGGLALTVAALHFSDNPDVRASVVAFSAVTQLVPTVVVLLRGRFSASCATSDGVAA